MRKRNWGETMRKALSKKTIGEIEQYLEWRLHGLEWRLHRSWEGGMYVFLSAALVFVLFQLLVQFFIDNPLFLPFFMAVIVWFAAIYCGIKWGWGE